MIKAATLMFLGLFSITATATIDVGFESGVPTNWNSPAGGLSVTSDHYKEGAQSLQWDWQSSGVLTVSDLQSQGLVPDEVYGYYKNTFYMWVYNSQPLDNESVTISFKDGSGDVQYHYYFYLNFKGWRPVAISYRYEMFGDKNSQDLQTMTIEAPAIETGGTLLFDYVDFTGDAITGSASSSHIPYKRDIGDNHWSQMHYYSTLTQNYAGETPSEEELSDLEAQRSYILNYIKGNAPSSSNLNTADAIYARLKITTNPDGTVKGLPLFGKNYTDNIGIIEEGLIHYARDFSYKGTTDSRTKFMEIIRYVLDQGYQEGCVMESVHHLGYYFRKTPLAILLMKTELKKEGLWDEAYNMAAWFCGLDGIWDPTSELSNMDAANTRTIARYACCFFKDTEAQQVQYLKGLRDYIQTWATPDARLGEGVKPDYTGFHHNFFYPARYVNPAYKSLSWAIYQMKGTAFEVNDQAKEVLKKTLLVSRICSNGKDLPMSIAGRANPLTTIDTAADGMKLLAESSTPTEEQLAKAYNLLEPSDLINGFSAEEYPTGFWQFNYGPLGVYRANDWVADIKGFNNHFMGQEIYAETSQYSRYSGYGALEILYAGGNDDSGKDTDGWNWNATPGATTIQLPWEELCANGRLDEKTDSEFCGALRFGTKSDYYLDQETKIEGQSGLFAMDFQQKELSPNHNPSFKFKKSVFCIDGKLICLGTDIQNNDTDNPTITTLFQNNLKTTSQAITVSGTAQTAFPLNQTLNLSGDSQWMIDNVGTGYFIPKGNDNISLTKINQSSPDESGSRSASGNFALACFNHGTAPGSSSYEYVVIPQTTASEMTDFSASTSDFYSVLLQEPEGHIIRSGSTEAYALFSPNSHLANTVLTGNSKPCLVMLEENEMIHLTLVNPVIEYDDNGDLDSSPVPIELTLQGTWMSLNINDNISVVSTTTDSTTLQFLTSNGEPIDVLLTKSALADNFTSTFTTATAESDIAEFAPIEGLDIQTFTPATDSPDGNDLDAAQDGYGFLHRVGTKSATIGMTRHLGAVAEMDVGKTISVDVAFNQLSGLACTWVLMLNDVDQTGTAKMVVDSFSSGQVSANQNLLLSEVPLGSINPQRTETGPLTYTLTSGDVGKTVKLKFSFYDSSNQGGEGTRNLGVDAISFRLLTSKEINYTNWMLGYGLTNSSDIALNGDYDGDGLDNETEYIAGTDPVSADDFPSINNAGFQPSQNQFTIQWNSKQNRFYDVYFSNSLTGTFSKVAENIEFPCNSYTSTVEQTQSCGFYRLNIRMD